MPILGWSWEFMRRSNFYRDYYLHWLADKPSELALVTLGQQFDHENRLTFKQNPNWTLDYAELAQNPSLYKQVPQCLPYTPSVAPLLSFPTTGDTATRLAQTAFDLRLGVVLIDPILPLHDQLKALEAELAGLAKAQTPRPIRRRADKFAMYLRLIDAADSGVTPGAIGRHLESEPVPFGAKDKDSIRNKITSAREWQTRFVTGRY